MRDENKAKREARERELNEKEGEAVVPEKGVIISFVISHAIGEKTKFHDNIWLR